MGSLVMHVLTPVTSDTTTVAASACSKLEIICLNLKAMKHAAAALKVTLSNARGPGYPDFTPQVEVGLGFGPSDSAIIAAQCGEGRQAEADRGLVRFMFSDFVNGTIQGLYPVWRARVLFEVNRA